MNNGRVTRWDYRWRALSPEQAEAIATAFRAGVSAAALAVEYRVNRRTIYRYLQRELRPRMTVVAFGQRATFVLGSDDEPVRMTPWVPA